MSFARRDWSFADKEKLYRAIYFGPDWFKTGRRARSVVKPAKSVPTVEQIAKTDNLIATYYEMKTRAGQAPGPDGIRYDDLSSREVADVMRQVSETVTQGRYVPGSSRSVQVPKLKGGFRTLRLGNLIDRVLAGALNKALSPFWEPIFLDWSMGFRPGRSVWRLLAELEAIMVSQDCWVLAQDDVKGAFDNVSIPGVMADHARYINDKIMLTVIKMVLQGNWRERRIKGIDQGCPFSPLALNVRLHHAHDLGVSPDHHPFRYADNIVYACRDVSVGLQALEQSRQLLEQAGFTLKSEDGPPVDLQRGEQAQLLGFTLRKKGDGLSFALGSSAWAKLKENLKKAHQTADPSRAASQTVAGWIDSAGPAYESKADRTLYRVTDTTAQLGFREISSPRELEAQWQLSWKRWCALREKTHRAALQGEGVLAPDGAGGCRLPA